ncbi:MAG TPA: PBP1A family penicillin-binding protein [Bryobacteraceae bacterium]|nr:PBP1A family penicillin-binding protein [Bryobacteraceae bacterium]
MQNDDSNGGRKLPEKQNEGGTPDEPVFEPRQSRGPAGLQIPRWATICLAMLLAVMAAGVIAFTWYYVKFARRVDAKLRSGPFAHTVNIYAAPESIAVGDAMTSGQLVARLRHAGYETSRRHSKGWYNIRPDDAVEIFPGPRSYFNRQQAGVVQFADGKIARIISLEDNTERREMLLEPLLITNVSDGNREKRRLVTFAQIPPVLVQAVTSVEDKHFFTHSGVDMLRVLKAAYVDLREGRKEQGASTLGMQLARSLWLHPDKSFRRKVQELLIALHLDMRLSKQQIFEYYANQVYLGRRGTFNINGFGEGARVFFGKEIGRLTVTEAATLAGMVQRPSYFNPLRHPDRALERRNLVLLLMRQNGYLTDEQYRELAAAPLGISPGPDGPADVEAQYFVDRVNDDLQTRISDQDRTDSIFTTLDLNLQRAAQEAVHAGMADVDKLLKRRARKGEALPPNPPQVALISLDPRTGEVKAMIGGRNYSDSQLDHALAMRQPGSAFKPFVFAAALNTAVEGGSHIFTPASTILDEPTVFQFSNLEYEPKNFGGRFMGQVTLRRALSASLNVATIKLAESVGYGSVVAMARRSGLDGNLQPTPALALGAYEATPLDLAGAYTVFANQGVYTKPALISMVRSPDGRVVYRHVPEQRRAMDPRVAYLMVNIMEDVVNRGTGASIRGRGFRPPAAGKTGTSRDSWFAGFTSQLLCVVWVGYDDNRDLNLEGSKAALPVWTEFMKKAHQFHPYSETQAFRAPKGVVTDEVCNESGALASPYCDSTRREVFIDGSQPVVECDIHNFVTRYVEGQIPGAAKPLAAVPAASPESADRNIQALPAPQ